MANDWSDTIITTDLADEPALSEELNALSTRLAAINEGESRDVVINMADLSYVNSSNIAQLLRVRKQMVEIDGRLILAGATESVWSVITMTGLDKVFEFATDKATAITMLQIGQV